MASRRLTDARSKFWGNGASCADNQGAQSLKICSRRPALAGAVSGGSPDPVTITIGY